MLGRYWMGWNAKYAHAKRSGAYLKRKSIQAIDRGPVARQWHPWQQVRRQATEALGSWEWPGMDQVPLVEAGQRPIP